MGGGGVALRHSPQTKVCGRSDLCFLLTHMQVGQVAVSRVAPSGIGATGAIAVAS